MSCAARTDEEWIRQEIWSRGEGFYTHESSTWTGSQGTTGGLHISRQGKDEFSRLRTKLLLALDQVEPLY
eukprot:scaffold126419_cov17-Tisochrysis_lutea.AAC.6